MAAARGRAATRAYRIGDIMPPDHAHSDGVEN
jgi:hypothetical protein